MQIFESDLNEIEQQLSPQLELLRNKRVFITGGTGFFGKWLLYSLVDIARKNSLNFEVTVLSRNPDSFLKKHPILQQQPFLKFVSGEVRSFTFPSGNFDYLIHGATEASLKLSEESPTLMFDVIVEGMRRVLEFAEKAKVKRFLNLSSGAVYGAQTMAKVPESFMGGPNPLATSSCYAEGKRAAELLGNLISTRAGFEVVHARCFAFVGPYLPLDTHFAIGNFILSCLKGEGINIKGDGTPFRSYLYPTDLVTWLFTLLFKGQNQMAYNVGSEKGISIRDLAQKVAQIYSRHYKGSVKIKVSKKAKKGIKVSRYVPSSKKIQKELGVKQTVDLAEAIRRTFEFETKGKSL